MFAPYIALDTYSPGASAPAEMPAPGASPGAQDEGPTVPVAAPTAAVGGNASDDRAVGDRATCIVPRQFEEFVAREAGEHGDATPAPARVDGWPERPSELRRQPHSAAPAQAAE